MQGWEGLGPSSTHTITSFLFLTALLLMKNVTCVMCYLPYHVFCTRYHPTYAFTHTPPPATLPTPSTYAAALFYHQSVVMVVMLACCGGFVWLGSLLLGVHSPRKEKKSMPVVSPAHLVRFGLVWTSLFIQCLSPHQNPLWTL